MMFSVEHWVSSTYFRERWVEVCLENMVGLQSSRAAWAWAMM
jgi:hypothetical protein